MRKPDVEMLPTRTRADFFFLLCFSFRVLPRPQLPAQAREAPGLGSVGAGLDAVVIDARPAGNWADETLASRRRWPTALGVVGKPGRQKASARFIRTASTCSSCGRAKSRANKAVVYRSTQAVKIRRVVLALRRSTVLNSFG